MLTGTLPSAFCYKHITLIQYLCIFIFHFSWTQQYKSNMILVNLRKDAKSGEVKTENHLLPTGGFFNIISSPHMFFEVVMYLALLGLLPRSSTWIFVVIWVFVNQVVYIVIFVKQSVIYLFYIYFSWQMHC